MPTAIGASLITAAIAAGNVRGLGLTADNSALFNNASGSGVYDGYNLRHYTRTMAAFSNDQEEILKMFPYICSRQALYVAIRDSGIASVAQRNPNGYTATQITDFIIDYYDQIMTGVKADGGTSSSDYIPLSLKSSIDAGYVWTQKEFWSNDETHFIFHNGDGAGVGHFVLGNVSPIVILPRTVYEVSTKEFKKKPFLGFDFNMMTSTFAAELDLDSDSRVTNIANERVEAGSFVSSTEYKIVSAGTTDFTAIGAADNNLGTNFTATGAGSGTGVAVATTGTVTDDADNPIPSGEIHPSLMFIYNHTYYNASLQPNGDNFGYNGASYTGHDDFITSNKYFDLRVAKFTVTVSGNKVTAIAAATRNDGDGNAVSGGWGYDSTADYKELTFTGTITDTSTSQIAPRVLYRTSTDQSSFTGNKATVDITADASEFYAGKDLTNGTYDAYAVPGVGETGFAVSPTGNFDTVYDEYFERNWPRTVLPASIRIGVERPTLVTTSRSLKTTRVGTGAHRYSFEFEYAPMEYDDFALFADAFELAHGSAREIQLAIPYIAMPHPESIFFDAQSYEAAGSLTVTDGVLGNGDITIQGVRPGYKITEGFYFAFQGDPKIYRVIDTNYADDYGRLNMKIEPSLLSTKTGSIILGRNLLQERRDFFLTKAFIVDDTLDYSIDAAGFYRFTCRFVEAI